MSNFKIEFTLKQHTPIIHFQSEQRGATLRATELKPKFDKFLKKYAFNGAIPKEYLIHQNKEALNYKVSINPNSSNPTSINSRDPLFFGNMGDGDKKFKMTTASFKITFFTYKGSLKTILENYFESFLANTNFGTRQSKGFGSFYLDKDFDKSLIKYTAYKFNANPNNYKDDMKILYAFMRQGINRVNRDRDTVFYSKPSIFSYMKKQNITWDKKAIKEKYFIDKITSQEKTNGEKRLLVRDLFGLSSEQSWMSYRKTVTKENKNLDRFKSPLTFKPILSKDKKTMHIYFWANESVEKILNEEFLIKVNRNGDLKLKTPKAFNFDDFFNFTFNIDLAKHIDSKFHNEGEYKTLSNIFKDIKGSH